MRFHNKRKTIKSDLNIRATAGITDTQMSFYKISKNDIQKTGGNK
ncbi:hypothetical protein [Bacteroidetes bacterium endosymbiont of Geopemphigus sp.]|nr:hypothetical protein [Bacteroidetes bacterium endosymbiont of Geopemphigus sp.]